MDELCYNINDLSIRTYGYLSSVFSYRLGMSEIGITDILIHTIVHTSFSYKINRVQVYKSGWKLESQYGYDIDLFIQRKDGKYNRVVLQAKVMSFNGTYADLTLKSKPNQWDKMLLHEKKYNSKSYYLLYNGKPNIKPLRKKPTRKDCLGIPKMEELGMGIVETQIVKNVRESHRFPYGKLHISEFFPDNMDSIRKLFCCDGGGFEYNEDEGYNYKEIYLGQPYELIKPFEESKFDDESNNEISLNNPKLQKEYPDLAEYRIIINRE